MSPERTIEDLVSAWIADHSGQPSRQERLARPNWWAVEALSKLEQQEPERCLDVILRISDATDDLTVLANLSAGPLEDLLAHHGEKVIGRVEKLANENAKFLQLVGGVWRNAMTDEIWQRVQALQKRVEDEH